MLKGSSKLISTLLVFFMLVTFIGSGYVEAKGRATDNQVLKNIGLGGLVVLGVWGIINWVNDYQQQQYTYYLERGQMYFQAGDYGLAIDNLKEASEIRSTIKTEKLLYKAKNNYQQKHYQLGSKYLSEEKWQLAYQEFKQVKRFGDYLDTTYKYQRAYQKLRKLKLKRIAIIQFEDNSYNYELGNKATSLFTAQLLSKDPKFIEVIEREQLNQIIKEQRLGATGLLSPASSQEIGNILGVDYLVVGEVISGQVSENKVSQYVEVYYSDSKKRRYEIQKSAYVHLYFKLLDVSNAAVVLSKKVEKKVNYSTSYYEGESVIIPSDEELIDEALLKAVDVFAQEVYNRYQL
ncbi:uncharacterized protein involved in formation of curli polymers [Halobacteroides halobius DSM 5150]|uniref:Uncharacterized protein involved in formation of curli polymers n=1 Tax=Halobacteroides halobius (strain ATCC 35273 / DSM 5150 / MD-1) TaxID=748449 RepID=L0KCF8_HALHC|nr:CsgG/HfaB family protein [Halobacteroides halobius]AGB42235.1 uncharacterized protein involved in formation of curli polymers [Halobacteroides halobius DSM 5150]